MKKHFYTTWLLVVLFICVFLPCTAFGGHHNVGEVISDEIDYDWGYGVNTEEWLSDYQIQYVTDEWQSISGGEYTNANHMVTTGTYIPIDDATHAVYFDMFWVANGSLLGHGSTAVTGEKNYREEPHEIIPDDEGTLLCWYCSYNPATGITEQYVPPFDPSEVGGYEITNASKFVVSSGIAIEDLDRMAQNGEKIDSSIPSWADKVFYSVNGVPNYGVYETWGGCTWYAMSRYNQVNGPESELKFQTAGGDADNWIHSIDKKSFTVEKTTDASAIKSNAIAVSTTDPGSGTNWQLDPSGNYIQASYKHVAYIEAVTDDYVYYTQGSYGRDSSTYGYVNKVTKEDFAKDYEYIIFAK